MNEEKLSSEQVPLKFAKWLLAMGCPPEDVPALDKISEMCRGQYYMVWRSLMEHVGPKDTILSKRLQVFNNDIVKCQKKNVFSELDVNMPKELSLWRQHTELKEQVVDEEARIAEERETLSQLVNKISSKLAHRNISRKRLQDAQRRSWLLQQVSSELRERRDNLQETKTIADSLCCVDDNQDVKTNVDRCISALSRPATATGRAAAAVSLLSVANPVASSTIASTNGDYEAEDQTASLVKCRGDVVFKQLFERRAGLCAMAASRTYSTDKDKDRRTPQSVLAHTAALHCNLALEAAKNRVHIKLAGKRLATTLDKVNDHLTGEACELLVLRCERAYTMARVKALRELFDELNSREGIFAVAGIHDSTAANVIHNVDKSILSKRAELKRLIVSAAAVESKTQNVKESLVVVFNSFHNSADRFTGASQMSMTTPQDTLSTVRQFYQERREKRQKIDLSMDLDVSEGCSYNELSDNGSPKFKDELRMYLKSFNLERNRKLVLESGEKIWIFETVQSSMHQLYSKWQDEDITTSMICPSVSLAHNLARLAQEVARKAELEALVRLLEDSGKKYELSLDISSTTAEEEKTLDKIKKRLNDNIINLQKTDKTLTYGIENLNIWSDNLLKQHISENRTVDGRTYKDYERAFLECLRM